MMKTGIEIINISKILRFLYYLPRFYLSISFIIAFFNRDIYYGKSKLAEGLYHIQSQPIVARSVTIETRPSKSDVFPQARKLFLSRTTRLSFLLRVLINQSQSNLAALLRIFRLFLASLSAMPTSNVNELISARQTGRPRLASELLFQPSIFPSA
jgi:hypothetical protein